MALRQLFNMDTKLNRKRESKKRFGAAPETDAAFLPHSRGVLLKMKNETWWKTSFSDVTHSVRTRTQSSLLTDFALVCFVHFQAGFKAA